MQRLNALSAMTFLTQNPSTKHSPTRGATQMLLGRLYLMVLDLTNPVTTLGAGACSFGTVVLSDKWYSIPSHKKPRDRFAVPQAR
jgi:hypothetical protein